MTPHLPRLCAVAVGLRLLACDGGGGPAGASDAGPGGGSLDGAADAHLPDTADARMRPLDCPAIRLSNGSLTLRECPETGELALATTPDGPVALRIQIRAEGPGEPLTPESLPGIAWRVAPPDVAVVRYTGENGPSPLESPDGDAALSLTVKLEGDRVLIRGALGWPAAAMFPGPYRPVVRLVPALGAPRSLGHGVFAVGTPSGALLLLSGAPEAGPEAGAPSPTSAVIATSVGATSLL